MRKTIRILCLFALLAGLADAGYAFKGWNSESCFRYFSIQGRDSYNRPAEENFVFTQSVFFKFYSKLSPAGVIWRRTVTDLEITKDAVFKIPHVIMPYINNNKGLLPRFPEKYFPSFLALQLLIFFSAANFILFYKPNLQSTQEPRFRVPVFLE